MPGMSQPSSRLIGSVTSSSIDFRYRIIRYPTAGIPRYQIFMSMCPYSGTCGAAVGTAGSTFLATSPLENDATSQCDQPGVREDVGIRSRVFVVRDQVGGVAGLEVARRTQ